jgi:cytochrome c-type protein NapC
MQTPALLIVLIATAIVLVAVIVFRTDITESNSGKALAFVALFVLPLIVTVAGVSQHLERSKQTQFCLSCHVMEDYGKSLHAEDQHYLAAAHFQNGRIPRDQACFTCHLNYTMYGPLDSKIRGLRHVYAQYIGGISQPIHLYRPYDSRVCLHCHEGGRSFEVGAVHNADPSIMKDIKANRLSCLSSDCHKLAHNVPQVKEPKMWQEAR